MTADKHLLLWDFTRLIAFKGDAQISMWDTNLQINRKRLVIKFDASHLESFDIVAYKFLQDSWKFRESRMKIRLREWRIVGRVFRHIWCFYFCFSPWWTQCLHDSFIENSHRWLKMLKRRFRRFHFGLRLRQENFLAVNVNKAAPLTLYRTMIVTPSGVVKAIRCHSVSAKDLWTHNWSLSRQIQAACGLSCSWKMWNSYVNKWSLPRKIRNFLKKQCSLALIGIMQPLCGPLCRDEDQIVNCPSLKWENVLMKRINIYRVSYSEFFSSETFQRHPVEMKLKNWEESVLF